MTTPRPIYTNAHDKQGRPIRVGAQVSTDPATGSPYVSVWLAGGPAIGGYWLHRFEGGKLTPATLRNLLAER